MRRFFSKIDFSFGTNESDIKPAVILVSEDSLLSKKLENNVFAFDAPEHFKSSFYVITTALTGEEQFKLKRYIWNENKYDLFFVEEKPESGLIATLYYAKTNPRDKEIKIASFTETDAGEIEKIKKWNFQSGAFWLVYSEFLDKIKKCKLVDEKLVEQLKQLKNKLFAELVKQTKTPDKIVQALIDRTLFIKFLEDNHIINSFFYSYHFPDKSAGIDYKTFLYEKDVKNLNVLFDKINKLFSNILFEEPYIEEQYISNTVMDLIYQAISQRDWKTGQLSLFDFRFDVIPIEFISHIYEVFLEKNQLDEGIYYTPSKLANLIIDDTILGNGAVFDPSCGSGMFLVLAFRKLLHNYNPILSEDINEIIDHRNNLIKKYIFGIEKNYTAWRLTVFSLYLEILKDISPGKVKEYINKKIKDNPDASISIDFSNNIINCNALETDLEKAPHHGKSFDYIVGNPPFFKIKSVDDEINFINKYVVNLDGKTVEAKNIIGYNQISQAFMLKLKDWSHPQTRFGFIQNSSNFYNDKSEDFQKFFFGQYQVETFYELSRVKDILFRKAKENVVVTIFSNGNVRDNVVKYYPVYKTLFSKVFDLIVIQEDKRIDIIQENIGRKIKLRDYLIGNEYDWKLLDKISLDEKLSSFLKDENRHSFRGVERAANQDVSKYFNIDIDKFNSLNNKEKTDLQDRFAKEKYLNFEKNQYYNTPYLYDPANIHAFSIWKFDGYINSKDVTNENFRRDKKFSTIFSTKKILFNRFGMKIDAVYVEYDCYFSTYIYGIKLQNENYYLLFTAILNSDLVNFYLLLKYRKRVDNNYANLDTEAIKNIPVPRYLNEDLVAKISDLSQKFTTGELKYEKQEKDNLNELIYDLYDLDYLERQRIKDFFVPSDQEITNHSLYKETLLLTLEMYFQDKPHIETGYNPDFGFDMVIVGVFFNNSQQDMPTPDKVFKYMMDRMIREDHAGITLFKEKIVGRECIYLIKNKQRSNWTETKAFEDGQEILKLLR
jgi:type I restriction-modification system DNA methylase subunit